MTYQEFKAIAFPDANCKFGAPMGRHSYDDPDREAQHVYSRRVPISQEGYDPGGAYWGIGNPLYCDFTADGKYRYYRRGK